MDKNLSHPAPGTARREIEGHNRLAAKSETALNPNRHHSHFLSLRAAEIQM